MTTFDPANGPYCQRCGEPQRSGDHTGCRAALLLEPPRFCEVCRRRMTVQVMPQGWAARCATHGWIDASRAEGVPSPELAD
ncbi:MAG: hypothetical protein KDC23_09535 [Actinobacteria bacterium]|nr:hypothetical protein [Actinomycetota bacterium]